MKNNMAETFRQDQAEFLKEKIYEILKSREEGKVNPDRIIVTVHVKSELFLEMAYLFIAKHGR